MAPHVNYVVNDQGKAIFVQLSIESEENESTTDTTIFLASIYDKSEEENISDKDLEKLIDDIQEILDDE